MLLTRTWLFWPFKILKPKYLHACYRKRQPVSSFLRLSVAQIFFDCTQLQMCFSLAPHHSAMSSIKSILILFRPSVCKPTRCPGQILTTVFPHLHPLVRLVWRNVLIKIVPSSLHYIPSVRPLKTKYRSNLKFRLNNSPYLFTSNRRLNSLILELGALCHSYMRPGIFLVLEYNKSFLVCFIVAKACVLDVA